jgi:hypothetical protein
VIGTNDMIVALYPSLAVLFLPRAGKRGKGRFYQHDVKIPLYPLCQRGIETSETEGFPPVGKLS